MMWLGLLITKLLLVRSLRLKYLRVLSNSSVEPFCTLLVVFFNVLDSSGTGGGGAGCFASIAVLARRFAVVRGCSIGWVWAVDMVVVVVGVEVGVFCW